MIDAVIENAESNKPVISQSFKRVGEAKRWLDQIYSHKPVDSGFWTLKLFRDNSEVPFFEDMRF